MTKIKATIKNLQKLTNPNKTYTAQLPTGKTLTKPTHHNKSSNTYKHSTSQTKSS